MRTTRAAGAEKRRAARSMRALWGSLPADATSPCNPGPRSASSAAVSGEPSIQIGDRVVHLQVPGVFTVVARRGPFFEVENARGLRMTLHQVSLRRLDGPPATPKDT